MVSFLHFPEDQPVFIEAAWDYQNLQNIRYTYYNVNISYSPFYEDKECHTGVMYGGEEARWYEEK
jgi:hypothetical protein